MAQIFRKSSLDQAASPDNLDEYIQVSNPSVWMILGAIVLLLAGGLVWACFGHLSDEQSGVLVVDGGESICYVEQAAAEDLDEGDPVSAGGAEGSVVAVDSHAVPRSELSATAQEVAPEDAGWFIPAKVAIDLPDGAYVVQVTVRTYNPIALLFAQG